MYFLVITHSSQIIFIQYTSLYDCLNIPAATCVRAPGLLPYQPCVLYHTHTTKWEQRGRRQRSVGARVSNMKLWCLSGSQPSQKKAFKKCWYRVLVRTECFHPEEAWYSVYKTRMNLTWQLLLIYYPVSESGVDIFLHFCIWLALFQVL